MYRARTVTWPGLTRLSGLVLGFGELAHWFLTGHPPESGVMTFAAGLIAAPNVAGIQHERNRARDAQARRRRRGKRK